MAPGQILADIETDKATIEWESQEDGYIARLLQPEGAQGVAVGSAVAVLVEDLAMVAAFKDYTAAGEGG